MSWGLLAYFPEEMVRVTRSTFTAGSYDAAGKWVPGTEVQAEIQIIAPQPIQADDLQLLPEGEEAIDLLLSFSQTPVKTRDQNQDADLIEWEGQTYKVLQVNPRAALGGFHRFIMGREPGQK